MAAEAFVVDSNPTHTAYGRVVNFTEGEHRWESTAEQDRAIHSIIYDHKAKTLSVLDQLKVPHETVFIPVNGVADAFDVIKKMQVRGAPLIATVGTLGLGVELAKFNGTYDELQVFVGTQGDVLISSRPTAINLKNAINDIKDIAAKDRLVSSDTNNLITKIQDAAYQWYLNEREENDRLLRNSTVCVEAIKPDGGKLVVMTICNTGSLATSSHGTALGVIKQLHVRGRLELAIVLETRPYNQGSRLTAYELQNEKIPFVLITDSMAASAMNHFNVDVVLVGADQVALNGDTANKVGTYMLACLASLHRIPFYVVTPVTSINPRIASGKEIVVEERPAKELITFNNALTAPEGTPVWNPAFDITPGTLITGILTDKGNVDHTNVRSLF
uniref:Translation initiation factor eIF-2B subunit alpha/beta/delta-like protein n=1 Tax=Panagrellus redivivus TaxID=6233 RepID=A0A7E4VHG7_PANRE